MGLKRVLSEHCSRHPHLEGMSTMQGSDKLEEFKQELTPCLACFCAETSCGPAWPLCFSGGKVCCCTQSFGLECPPCWVECNESWWSDERGICEVSQKMCCIYTEFQFPPGRDIGCGMCGLACCRTADDKPEEESKQDDKPVEDDKPEEENKQDDKPEEE